MCRWTVVGRFAGATCVDDRHSATRMSSRILHRMSLDSAAPPAPSAAWTRRRHRHSSERRVGRLIVVAAVVLVVTIGAAPLMVEEPAAAQTSDEAAKQAAREIQAARDRANAAAAAFLQAQSDLEVLQDQAKTLEDEATVLQDRVDRLRRDVQSLAVARFATSGSKGIPLLTGLQAPKDQVQADVLVDVVTDAGSSSLDEFDLAQKQLIVKQQELDQRRYDIVDQQAVFTQLQADADAEVDRLREIEEQRLTDEAVMKALEAQQQASLAEWVEAELRNNEAAARAQPNPGVVAAQAAIDAAAAAVDPTAADGDLPTDGVPVPTLAPNTGPSGSTSGGRTGTGGAGSAPIGVLNGEVYIDAIICPMPGAAYGDSWVVPQVWEADGTKASTCSLRWVRRSTPSSADR